MQAVHGLLGQLVDQRIVVQAAGGGGLHIVGVLHIAVLSDTVEGELMAVHDHLWHEVLVSGMQVGQLRGLEGHVVPVHVEALIGGTGEQIGAVGIDAGNDDHIDVVQHLLAVAAAQIGDPDQRPFAGGGLVGMDLGLDPDGELAVIADQLAGLLQRFGGGQVGLGEYGDGHIVLIGGGLAQAVQVHILFRLVLRRQIAHHLILGGELMVGPVLGEEGGVIFLEILQRVGGEVLVQHLVRPEDQQGVPGALVIVLRHVCQFGRGGLIACIGHLPRLHLQLQRAGVQVLLRYVEDLANIVVAIAPDPVAVCAGLADQIVALCVLFHLGQGLEGVLAAVGGNTFMYGDGDVLGLDV